MTKQIEEFIYYYSDDAASLKGVCTGITAGKEIRYTDAVPVNTPPDHLPKFTDLQEVARGPFVTDFKKEENGRVLSTGFSFENSGDTLRRKV